MSEKEALQHREQEALENLEKEALQNLIREFSGFENWGLRKQLPLIGWFLHRLSKQQIFTGGRYSTLFLTPRFQIPS